MKKHLLLLLALFIYGFTNAQITLGPSPYNQDFNSIASGLPSGFTVRTGATSGTLGTAQVYSGAAVAWNNTTGAFKNFASANGLTSAATSTQQNSSTDRSLGVRQTGTLGDPGAAFVMQLANTTGLKDFKLSFKLQSLDVTSPRVTTWRVDYGLGATPTTFTAATATGTLTTGGSAFSSNVITVDFGNSLNNQPADVWIRIVTVTASIGSGNRASSSIDDLSLTYNTGTVASPSFSVNPTTLSFGNQALGTTSAAQSHTLTYANLDGSNVSVSTVAPFSISKSAAGPFSATLTFTAGELSGTSTTIYSQFSPTSAGAANASISHTGGGVSGSTTVVLSGTGVNLNPAATNDSFSGYFGDVIAGNVATNDSDPQSLSLTYTKLTDPIQGTLIFNSDGTFSYQSVSGSATTQTFTYRVSNTLGLTADATVSIALAEKSKIFISQYYEGGSVNKWIELTNPTNAAVNTSSPQLKLALYSISGDAGNIVISGSPSQVMNLNITIPAKSSVLIGNTGNGTEVPYLTAASAQQSNNSVINFNGNDGVALLDAANNIVDAFGTGINAKDVSYVRNQDALTPSNNFIVTDWTRTTLATVQNAADLDDPNRLGTHVQPELPPCTTPASQPTSLSFTSIGTKTITLNFSSSTDANEYLIVRSLSGVAGTPVDGVVYNIGNSIGGGVVAGRISGTTFIDSNLPNGTTCYYFIYALNSISCDGGPKYLTQNPLTGVSATEPLPVCQVPSAQASNFQVTFSNYNTIQGSFTPASGVDEFLVVMSKDSTLNSLPADQTIYSVGDTLGGGIVIKKGAQGLFSRSSLTQNTNYYFFIFSLNSNCSSGPLYLTSAPLTGKQKTSVFNSSALNFYFGNLHSHSSYSDGNKDDTSKKPEDDYAFAKNSRKMDFLGISEHNHTQAGMRLANWAPGIQAAKNATTSDFVALHGMEWGVISGGGHVVVYGIDSLIGWEPGEYQIYVPKSTYTGPTGLFNIINRHGLNAIATLAHPNMTDYNNVSANYDALADSAIVGSALESGPAFSTNVTYSDPASSMSYLAYYNKMLSKGYHLGATIDHDNHNMTFGRHTRARLVVLAPALTENDLLDAIKKMHFYASEDSAARVTYTINNQIVGSIFSGNGIPQISVTASTTNPITSISIMRGAPGNGIFATAIATVNTSSLTLADSTLAHLSTGYYYADITESDGSRIITSPIWYTRNDSLKLSQTITFNALATKTYGDPDFTPAATSTNTSIPVTYTSSDSTIAKVVGNSIHIRNAGTVTITAHQSGSTLYKPAAPVAQTLVISPLAISANIDAKIKVYGDADPLFTYTFAPALVNGDSFTGSLSRTAGENSGAYIIRKGSLSLSANYNLSIDSALLTIDKKLIVATGDAKQKTYGDADPEFTYSFTPSLINGDAFSGSLTRTAGENVGTYVIKQGTLALSPNYRLTFDSAALTIVPKNISAKADAAIKTYGTSDPQLTYTFTPSLVTPDVFSGALTREAGENVGTYSIQQGTLALSANYNLSFDSALFTITPAAQAITFNSLSDKIYGDSDFVLTATGGASGNPVTFTSSNLAVATVANGAVHIVGAGTTTIVASQAGNGNYSAATNVSQNLTINKAIATLSLSNLSQNYDGTPKAVATATTPLGLDGVSVTYDGSLSAPSAVGTYGVVATLSNTNYEAAPVSGTLTIVQPIVLKVQYRNADGVSTNNEGKPYLKIINTGIAVQYSQVTMRYWLTPENFTGSLGLWIDYAQLGSNKVTMKYVSSSDPRVNALGYIEYGFTAAAGSLLPGNNSGEIQSRFANSDWSSFNEANDYSMRSNSSYTDNNSITLYHNGILIWGTEPAVEAPVVKLKVYTEAKTSGTSNSISTFAEIRNEGNIAVDYKDITTRYWFTRETSSPLKLWVDYAKLGASAITGNFVTILPVRMNADAYFEMKVNPAATTLYPLSSTGAIQYRITKSDWSNFNQSNDYSFQSGTMAVNQKVTVYYKGQLIHGIEPASGNSSARLYAEPNSNEIQAAETSAVLIYPNPSNGKFTLVLDDQIEGAFNTTIYDAMGKLVDAYTGESHGEFKKVYDLQLAQGIYVIVITGQGRSERKKIIIN